MGKVRIVELAKKENLKVTDLIQLGKVLNIEIKNAMSSVTEEEAKKILENQDKIKNLAPKKSQILAQDANKTEVEENLSHEQSEKDTTTQTKQPIQPKPQNTNQQPTENETRRPQQQNRDGQRPQNNYARPQQSSNYQGNRNQGQNTGFNGNRDGQRPQNNYARPQQSSNYQGNRNQGQNTGFNGNRDGQRPQNNYPRPQQSGNYQGNRNQGQNTGFNGNRDGQRPQQSSNYQGNRGQGQRPFQQNQNNRFSGGPKRQFGGALNERNLEKQLSDLATPVVAESGKTRVGFVDNKDRRVDFEEKKSKKQIKEERRLEDKRMAQNKNKHKHKMVVKSDVPKILKHRGNLTVGEVSQQIGVPVAEIIKYLLGLGILATINHSLDIDALDLIAAEYNAKVEYEAAIDETDLAKHFESEDEAADLVERAPIITIMGHVDHGKTTLLDALRKTKVVDGEAGGITQHIGAYQIEHDGKKLTFLDTPGHEAFTSMRARGAQITDIAIIVVAADDGVMPQTKEAVEHAKAAEVPIIVAVNKMDKPGADPTRVMQGLTELGLQPEAWGGATIFAEISAKSGTGIDHLLEMILLVSELEELKANPKRPAIGTVIEAKLDKGKGSVATLLVQNGTLNVGDPIVVGNTFGRVRTMEDDFGKRLKIAEPSMPVEVTGLVGVPSAGDHFVVFESEKKARQIGEIRAESKIAEQRRKSAAMNLEDLNRQIQEGEIKDIHLIVKADVQGSVEAVAQSFAKIDVAGVRVKIVRAAVGAITESDVMLALASNAIIYGFNVRPDANTRQVAEREGVEIRLHTIIYKAIEEIEAAMVGMLDPEFEEVVEGQAQVRTTFKVSKIGTIAGCMVISGEMNRDASARLIRDGVVVYDGRLNSLKRGQDDAKQVATGYECGVTLENYNDIKDGDIIETYKMQEIKK